MIRIVNSSDRKENKWLKQKQNFLHRLWIRIAKMVREMPRVPGLELHGGGNGKRSQNTGNECPYFHSKEKAQSIISIESDKEPRILTGIGELNRVLGGGSYQDRWY